MDIEEIKKIDITDLLNHLGYNPVRKKGSQWYYNSPFRDERTASFSVSTEKNIWKDFGDSRAGNIIDLAIALRGNCTLHSALMWLEEQYKCFGTGISVDDNIRKKTFLNPKRPSESDIRDVHIEPLTHRALLSYLMSRSIPIDIGIKYCKEVHYTVFNKEYFGICFMNILGGMEIRNPYFKGCHGEKAPSVITLEKDRKTEFCCVFEGFMDFLSYMTLKQRGNDHIVQSEACDCIVLNSTSIASKAVPFINVYGKAYCYLDNDDAGKAAFHCLKTKCSNKVFYVSTQFDKYKDLNEYIKSL